MNGLIIFSIFLSIIFIILIIFGYYRRRRVPMNGVVVRTAPVQYAATYPAQANAYPTQVNAYPAQVNLVQSPYQNATAVPINQFPATIHTYQASYSATQPDMAEYPPSYLEASGLDSKQAPYNPNYTRY